MLLATVFGAALIALLILTNIASLVYSARSARILSYRLAARDVVQGVLEQMYADAFEDVDPANYPSLDASDPGAPVLDSLQDMRCAITIEIEGEREVTSATPNSVTVNGADWEPNRWVGNTVFVTGGPGLGQRALITANTADTLTTSLIGYSQTTWVSQPTSSSRIMINGGKMVSVTATFDFRGTTYTETVEGLVVRDD